MEKFYVIDFKKKIYVVHDFKGNVGTGSSPQDALANIRKRKVYKQSSG